MKKIFVSAFLIVLLGLSSAEASVLNIYNQSTSDIHAIYISDSSSSSWEENIIDGYYLPSGNYVDVTIGTYKTFDLRVEDEDGNYENYTRFPGDTAVIVLYGGGEAEYK